MDSLNVKITRWLSKFTDLVFSESFLSRNQKHLLIDFSMKVDFYRTESAYNYSTITAQKMKFSLRIYSVNVIKPAGNLLWVPNFVKIGHIAILKPNLPKFLVSGQEWQFQISYLRLTNLICADCQIS